MIGPRSPGCLLLVPKALSQKHENVIMELLEFVWSEEGLNRSVVESRQSLHELDGFLLIVRYKVGYKLSIPFKITFNWFDTFLGTNHNLLFFQGRLGRIHVESQFQLHLAASSTKCLLRRAVTFRISV